MLAPDQAREVYAQVDRLTAVNAALYAAAEEYGADDDMRARVDQWHDTAYHWQLLAGSIVDQTNPRLSEWAQLGNKLASNAKDLADALESDTARAKIRAFVRGFPAALRAAGAAALTVASSAARSLVSEIVGVLPWPVWLAVGAGVAVGGWLYFGAPRRKAAA